MVSFCALNRSPLGELILIGGRSFTFTLALMDACIKLINAFFLLPIR